MINFRVTNRLHYLNSSIEVVQRLPAGADDWFLAGASSTPIIAYQPISAASEPASYINLPNPGTYDAFAGIVPGWDAANGWTLDIGEYLRTGWTHPTTQDWAMLCRFSDAGGQTTNPIVAAQVGSGRYAILSCEWNSGFVLYGNRNPVQTAPAMTAGTLGFCGTNCYRDGVLDATISAGSYTSAAEIFIGAVTGLAQVGTKNIQAVAIWSPKPTDADFLAVENAMAAL